ncbi:MAG TPA: hypothetical protein VG168_06655 [Bryobacteraceae bacterium]|nr:hypothetical protein [Bryobacteraceae bacterium]
MSTPAQIAANQANAQLSAGPKTSAGKAKSSLNAVSTGLTGRTVLLPGDDAKLYSEHMASFFVSCEPATPEEEALVRELAETRWRLDRIPQLEYDLWALGAVLFANMFEDQPEEVRPGLIRAHTFVTYGKRFHNLFLQESRLNRRYDKLMKQLVDLKRQRLAAEAAAKAASKASNRPNGFEFSNSPGQPRPFTPLAEIRERLKEVNPRSVPSFVKDRS